MHGNTAVCSQGLQGSGLLGTSPRRCVVSLPSTRPLAEHRRRDAAPGAHGSGWGRVRGRDAGSNLECSTRLWWAWASSRPFLSRTWIRRASWATTVLSWWPPRAVDFGRVLRQNGQLSTSDHLCTILGNNTLRGGGASSGLDAAGGALFQALPLCRRGHRQGEPKNKHGSPRRLTSHPQPCPSAASGGQVNGHGGRAELRASTRLKKKRCFTYRRFVAVAKRARGGGRGRGAVPHPWRWSHHRHPASLDDALPFYSSRGVPPPPDTPPHARTRHAAITRGVTFGRHRKRADAQLLSGFPARRAPPCRCWVARPGPCERGRMGKGGSRVVVQRDGDYLPPRRAA